MKFSILLAALMVANPLPAAAVQPNPVPAETPAGSRFSVIVEGSGPDVILIPGLMSGRNSWDGAAAALKGAYRIHRIQVAGFAGEPAGANADGAILTPLVEALARHIAAEDLDRPAIVGHSMGGLIGLMLAQRHPERVGRLMIVDALPFYSLLFSPHATADSVAPQAAAIRESLLAMDADTFAARQSAAIAGLVKSEAARPSLVADSLASDRSVAARAMFELMTTDVRPGLPSISAPVMIVFATNAHAPRPMVEPLYRRAYASLRRADFAEVPDSHHFLMLDQPQRFQALLGQFLAGD